MTMSVALQTPGGMAWGMGRVDTITQHAGSRRWHLLCCVFKHVDNVAKKPSSALQEGGNEEVRCTHLLPIATSAPTTLTTLLPSFSWVVVPVLTTVIVAPPLRTGYMMQRKDQAKSIAFYSA